MASWISCPSRNILLAFAKGRMRRRRRHHHRQLLLLYTSTTINPDMAAGIFYFLLFCFLLGRPLLLLPFFSSSSSISAALGSSNSVHTHICTHARFTLHGPSLFCSTHGEKRCVSLGRGGNEMKGRRKKRRRRRIKWFGRGMKHHRNCGCAQIYIRLVKTPRPGLLLLLHATTISLLSYATPSCHVEREGFWSIRQGIVFIVRNQPNEETQRKNGV